MPKLKGSQLRVIDDAFDMHGGYVLDFSDKTIAEFFDEELDIDICDKRYTTIGTSKAKRVRSFIEQHDPLTVARLLRKLWEYKEPVGSGFGNQCEEVKNKLFALIEQLESVRGWRAARTLSKAAVTLDLDTVSRDLDRALENTQSDPESALTSACSTLESVCRSVLTELDIDLPKNKDLPSLYKAVREPLGLTPKESEFPTEIANDVLKVLRGLSTVVEGIGALRTHGGDAHGRERGYSRVDARIAALAVHSASSVSLFLLETWQRKYPGRPLTR